MTLSRPTLLLTAHCLLFTAYCLLRISDLGQRNTVSYGPAARSSTLLVGVLHGAGLPDDRDLDFFFYEKLREPAADLPGAGDDDL